MSNPIFPHSAVPITTDKVFPHVHVSDDGNSHSFGLGVIGSLDADSIWRLNFKLPTDEIPSGTFKLNIDSLAHASTGVAVVNPQWASIANGESLSDITLNDEGSTSITWTSSDDDAIKTTKIDLDADTPVAGETIFLDLYFLADSWTLTETSTHAVSIIWE